MEKDLTFLIEFLGCKVNSYEVECIANELENEGYSLFNEAIHSEPTLILINTCAVTHTSVIKDRKMIRHYKNKYPNSLLIVMGCYASFDADYISSILGADIVIGTQNRNKLLELINDYKTTKKPLIIKNNDEWKYEEIELDHFLFNTRAYVKIQDGCNNFCSYCLIPFVRGRSRSRKKEDISYEISRLISHGYKEVVLTGIDMSSYGFDLYDDFNFSDLLEYILENNKDLYRLRISSIEESNIDEKFLKLLGKYKNIANHLHIPLQSGSKKIVERMNRKYNLNEFKEKIKKIRQIRPDIAISTDIIVGFPGETEEDFLETYNNAKEINFSKIHVFPFSPRKGTLAEKMKDQVDGNIKKERVNRLIELSTKLEKDYENKFIGQKMDFLFESGENNIYKGHSSNFLEISIDSKENINGKILDFIYKN